MIATACADQVSRLIPAATGRSRLAWQPRGSKIGAPSQLKMDVKFISTAGGCVAHWADDLRGNERRRAYVLYVLVGFFLMVLRVEQVVGPAFPLRTGDQRGHDRMVRRRAR